MIRGRRQKWPKSKSGSGSMSGFGAWSWGVAMSWSGSGSRCYSESWPKSGSEGPQSGSGAKTKFGSKSGSRSK